MALQVEAVLVEILELQVYRYLALAEILAVVEAVAKIRVWMRMVQVVQVVQVE